SVPAAADLGGNEQRGRADGTRLPAPAGTPFHPPDRGGDRGGAQGGRLSAPGGGDRHGAIRSRSLQPGTQTQGAGGGTPPGSLIPPRRRASRRSARTLRAPKQHRVSSGSG